MSPAVDEGILRTLLDDMGGDVEVVKELIQSYLGEAPRLLAESERGASAPIHFRSNLASQSLDLDTYRNKWNVDFKTNGFELIHNAVPEVSGQERSQ